MSRKRRYDILQEAAADCCIRIMMQMEGAPECVMKAMSKLYDEIYEVYGLRSDPFTHFPCSDYEYYHSLELYERQRMEDTYGYY